MLKPKVTYQITPSPSKETNNLEGGKYKQNILNNTLLVLCPTKERCGPLTECLNSNIVPSTLGSRVLMLGPGGGVGISVIGPAPMHQIQR